MLRKGVNLFFNMVYFILHVYAQLYTNPWLFNTPFSQRCIRICLRYVNLLYVNVVVTLSIYVLHNTHGYTFPSKAV